ncbi:hypothetical protein K438DRAFT_1968109 [Mycena galopus ATCC 62051]|nr:hypothetical protein K438DRAFT_1968109 [Mycena galopus ATCC 62051]
MSTTRSQHAAAQAKYRAKNAGAEREKARLRMRRLREKRKEVTEERNSRGETYEEFMARECKEFRSAHEYQEFREFCNKVKAVHLHVDFEDANEVAAVEKFLASNPSIEDLPAYDEDYIEYLYRRQERYPEWREELADYRDIVAENTPEELDRLQAEAHLKLPSRYIILARGGF